MTIEQAGEILQSEPDPYTRCSAVESLAHAEHTPKVLQLLLKALSDEGYYEIPEPGAPSFIYSVAELASRALESWGPEAFDPLVAAMKACDKAAVLGAWLMPRHGQAGLGVLRELLQHPNSKVVGAALGASSQILREDGLRGVPELVSALFPLMLHPDGQVRYSSSSSLAYFFEAHPELDPKSFVGPGFLAQLADGIAACRILPEVGKLFGDDDRIFSGWVESACQGYEQGTWPLLAQLERLNSAQVGKLVNGKLTPALIKLLGKLGPRAAEAVPALMQAKNDPRLESAVAVALLQILANSQMVTDEERLKDLFFEDESARAGIIANYPHPEALAAGLIPRLIEQWNSSKDLKALRGLETLGPLMMPAMPWLLASVADVSFRKTRPELRNQHPLNLRSRGQASLRQAGLAARQHRCARICLEGVGEARPGGGPGLSAGAGSSGRGEPQLGDLAEKLVEAARRGSAGVGARFPSLIARLDFRGPPLLGQLALKTGHNKWRCF